jgi:dipeptidyl aminopeptidase/acylaminoacyl peptidase
MHTILTVALLALRAGSLAQGAPAIVERHPVTLSADAQKENAAILNAARVEGITYLSDGLRIHGYLATPKAGKGPFPALILNRGGNANLGVFTDDHAVVSLGTIAAWGYVVVASQYRGAGGSEGTDEFGGADVNDVLNLLPVIDSLPQADRARVGIYGASRGGMMAYIALTRSDRFKAAIVLSGMSDLFENAVSRPEMDANFKRFMPDYAASRDQALARRSAIRWVDKLPVNVPILILHGTADWRVAPSEAFDMARALTAAKHPVRFMMFEGGSHGVPEFDGERNAAMRAWLDAYLRDGKPWPDLNPHGS